MCGVVGYFPQAVTVPGNNQRAFARLFEHSTIRGLHAFGLMQPEHELVRSFDYWDVITGFDPLQPAIAHARYCTSGDWRVLENNQPIVIEDDGYHVSLVFNGVIDMGTKAEMEQRWGVVMATDNDGEIFLRCMEGGETAEAFLSRIRGSFAGCWIDGDGRLWAARNARRPLWRAQAYGAIWYASTRDIFQRAGGFALVEEIPVGVEQAKEG